MREASGLLDSVFGQEWAIISFYVSLPRKNIVSAVLYFPQGIPQKFRLSDSSAHVLFHAKVDSFEYDERFSTLDTRKNSFATLLIR